MESKLNLLEEIKSLAKKFYPEVRHWRAHLHANPELSFQEYATSQFIQEILKENNISFTSGIVGTGIVGEVEGRNPESKVVLLRADMDALPITEKNNVSYKSKVAGIMHACGHDVHTASLLGALKILTETKNNWAGTVKFIFQPGEEVLPGGASLMIKEGILDNPTVDAAIAQHVFPSMETGKVGFKSGMYMASTDELYITVKGKGGHAAMPTEYNNPILIAAEIVTQLNSIFMNTTETRNLNSVPTVLAFGKIEGLGATNVIPETVEICGTFRTMNEEWRNLSHARIKHSINEICKKNKAEAEVRIERGYPFLINDEKVSEHAKKMAETYLGKENVEDLPLRMTAEDFAYISQQVPSCFYRLGTGNKQKGITSGVHSATFDIDERALEIGSGLMAWLAVSELSR